MRKFHAAHQPVHSADADGYAIVTLKDVLYFVGPQAFVVISINMQYHAFNALVFRNPGGGFFAKMLVISASVDI